MALNKVVPTAPNAWDGPSQQAGENLDEQGGQFIMVRPPASDKSGPASEPPTLKASTAAATPEALPWHRAALGYAVHYGDRYGETEAPASLYQPQMGPKTPTGVCCSLTFGGLVLALILIQFLQFLDTSNFSLNLGPDTEITGNYDPDEWPGLPGDPAADERYAKMVARGYANRPTMYLPTLLADFSVNIQFFEDAAPGSLQKIEVIDNTGYEPYWASSLKDDPPRVQSVIQEAQVSFESFAEDLQQFESPKPPVEFDLASLLAVQATHEELAEPLKAIYAQNGIIGSPSQFSANQVHLFVRFKETQLSKLKSCQLQTYLFNAGVSKWLRNADPDAFKDRESQSAANFPTLTSSQTTFAPNNFANTLTQGLRWKYTISALERKVAGVEKKDELQVIHISSHLSAQQVAQLASTSAHGPQKLNLTNDKVRPAASELMSWKFGVNYVNNFVHMQQDYQCDSRPLAIHGYASGIPLSNGSIADLNCGHSECDLLNVDELPASKPFYVLISSIWGAESAKVLYRNGKLERADKATMNHSKAAPGWWTRLAFEAFPWDLQNISWRCNPDEYFKGDKICDCECGAYDPDCGEYMGDTFQEIRHCKSEEFCSLGGKCMRADPAQLAAMWWEMERDDDDNFNWTNPKVILPVYISERCSEGMSLPGEEHLRGFVGSQAELAAVLSTGSCPGDALYSFAAQRTSDGEYVCNMESSGIMNAQQMEWAATASDEPLVKLRRADGIQVSMALGASPPFPSGRGNLTVVLNQGNGNSERLTAWNITPPDNNSRQTMILSKPGRKPRPRFSHLSKGFLLSAVDGASKEIYVLTDWHYDKSSYEDDHNDTTSSSERLLSDEEDSDTTGDDGSEDSEESENSEEEGQNSSEVVTRVTTALASDVSAGATSIAVADTTGLSAGMSLSISDGTNSETAVIDEVTTTRRVSTNDRRLVAGTVELDRALVNSYSAGTTITAEASQAAEDDAATGGKSSQSFIPALNFDTRGPYDVFVDDPGVRLRIASATPRTTKQTSIQTLELAEPPSFSLGFRSYLMKEAKVGSNSITVRRTGFYKLKNHLPFYLTLSRGLGAEAVKITAVGGYASEWTCSNAQFAGSDGCQCGCGIWDPDCGMDPSIPASTRPFQCPNSNSQASASNIDPSEYGSEQFFGGGDESEDSDHVYYDGSTSYCLFDTNGPKTKKNKLPYRTRCVTAANGLSAYHQSAYKLTDLHEQSLEIFTEELNISASTETKHPGGLLETFPFKTPVSSAVSYKKIDGEVRANPIITLSSLVPIQMLRPGSGPFKPEKRYLPGGLETTTSPEALQATFALFMVPDRKSFADANFSLCPKVSTAKLLPKAWTDYGFDKWELVEDRKMKLACHGPQEVDSATCLDPTAYKAKWNSSYRLSCLSEMPPTATFGYTATQHVNEKWKGRNTYTSSDARANGFRAPELNLDVSHVFHFSHSEDDEEVEKKFAAGRKVTGDTDQDGTKHYFFGAPLYRGKGRNGTTSSNQGYPANHPFLKPALKIRLAPSAVSDIQKARPLLWYWAREKWTEDIVKKFQNIDIAWDTSLVGGSAGQLLLVPGQQYTLEAQVSLWPVIRRPMFLADFFEHYESFGYSIDSASVIKEKLGSFQKRQAVVRVKVNFNTVEANVREHNMPFELFLTGASAATGLFALGYYALYAFQCLFCKVKTYHKWALEQQAEALRGTDEASDSADS